VAENHQFLLDHTRDSQIEFDCHGWGYIVGGSDGNKTAAHYYVVSEPLSVFLCRLLANLNLAERLH